MYKLFIRPIISYLNFINNSKTIDVSFAESLLEQLRRKLTLTVKQIEGINKWFDNAEEKMLKIKTKAFVYNEQKSPDE